MQVSTTYANQSLRVFDKANIDMEALKGKWVIINYWASWCQPCVNEISELNKFYKKNHDIELFAVNYDAVPPLEQKQLTKKFAIEYPALSQDPAAVLNLGDIRGVPVTFIINPDGKLDKTLYGAQTVASLNQAIN